MARLIESGDLLRDSWHYRFVKRSADIGLASIALILASPIFALSAFLIKLEDRGPVLYSQQRVGVGGRHFRFWKLRSMRVGADQIRKQLLASSDSEGPTFKMWNDPRVTRVGRYIRKYSIDELPQLVSVLLGDMSLVGPRPHIPEEVAQYSADERVRLRVKPGLICLREVSGRSHLSFEDWIRLDREYIEKRSLALDVKIILRAIPAVFMGHGAC